MQVGTFLQRAAQVAVGKDADHALVRVNDGGDAHPASRHLDDCIGERCAFVNTWHILSRAHDIAHVREKFPTERPAGMGARKFVAAETFCLHDGDRKRVPKRERRSGAGRGREVERTGFFLRARVDVHVGFAGESRLFIAGEGDQLGSLPLDHRHDRQQLGAFTGVRESDEHVVERDHAEVAVTCFGGVHEVRRRARARHRGGNLACDMARLSNPADYDAAMAIKNQAHRLGKTFVEFVDQGSNCRRLDLEHLTRKRKRTARVG